MLIQNKRTGETIDINSDKWEGFKKLGWGLHWTVIQKDTPLKVNDFQEPLEIKPKKKKKQVELTEELTQEGE